MSGFQQQTTSVQGVVTKLTANTAKTIVDATENAYLIHKLQFNENFGGTPSLTVDLYDGTTSTCLGTGGATWKAKAVTAGQSVEFTDFLVPKGCLLRGTSSDAAGKFDVVGLITVRTTNA